MDINYLRKNYDAVRHSQNNRFKDISLLDKSLELHYKYINESFEFEKLNEIKDLSGKVMRLKINANEIESDNKFDLNTILSDLKKLTKSDLSNMVKESYLMNLNTTQIKTIIKKLDEAIATSKDTLNKLDINRMYSLNQIGNILHRDVFISNNLSNNQLIRTYGDTTTTKRFSHLNLIKMIDGIDLERIPKLDVTISYIMSGACDALQTALIKFGIDFLRNKNFSSIDPLTIDNFFMKRVLFTERVFGAEDEVAEKKQCTSQEEKILEFHRDRRIEEYKLPIKYLIESGNISREVGIFESHEFKEIDLLCIAAPVKSQQMFHEMIGNSESFYQALGIPYQLVSIVSGALDNAATIKYQLEGWCPGSRVFRDLAWCSNCTDYLARSVLTRYGETKADPEYVHMLRGTLLVTARLICAILENHQTEYGIVVPTVLQRYMPNYIKFIHFVYYF